jgi:hypothetical protein
MHISFDSLLLILVFVVYKTRKPIQHVLKVLIYFLQSLKEKYRNHKIKYLTDKSKDIFILNE